MRYTGNNRRDEIHSYGITYKAAKLWDGQGLVNSSYPICVHCTVK